MIKRIAIDDLAVGMYIQALDGPWLSHPFWKTHFLLTRPEDLQMLKSCGMVAAWVDLARGQGVETDMALLPPAVRPE